MFRGLIDDAKSAAGAVISKYAVRASVVVPFVLALGFATAAVTYVLASRFGPIAACLIIAAGFTAIGLIGLFTVKTTEHELDVMEQAAAREQPGDVASVAVAAGEAASHVPLALLGGLIAAAGGPTSTMGAARIVAKNLPLILLVAAIGVLLLPQAEAGEPTTEAEPGNAKLNGAHPIEPESARPRT